MKSGIERTMLGALLAIGALGLVACGAQPAGDANPPATIAEPTSAVIAAQPSPISVTATQAPTQPSATAAPAVAATRVPAQAPSAQVTATQASSALATCTSPAALTPSQTEGPYFKAGSPERTSLLTSGTQGTKLVLTGYVLTADCKPVANAQLDFWQADASGNYDNSGYTLRGHQYTDASGRFTLTTVVPGLYPGRTEHIHVKVQAPNGPVLTTQLYFPGVANNSRDGIYNAKLLMNIQNSADGLQGTFNFIINTK